MRMKIDVELPPAFARKWKCLLADQGGDPEGLALAAVDLLWEKYGKDAQRSRRMRTAQEKRLEDCRGKLNV